MKKFCSLSISSIIASLFVSNLNKSFLHLISFKRACLNKKEPCLPAWIKPLWCIFYSREPASSQRCRLETRKLKPNGNTNSASPILALYNISNTHCTPIWVRVNVFFFQRAIQLWKGPNSLKTETIWKCKVFLNSEHFAQSQQSWSPFPNSRWNFNSSSSAAAAAYSGTKNFWHSVQF